MRSAVLSVVILLTGGAFVLSGKPKDVEQFRTSHPAAELARIETARLFSASPERYDVTHSIAATRVPQPPETVSWPEVPKPKIKKRTVATSDARSDRPARERKPVMQKQVAKKLPTR